MKLYKKRKQPAKLIQGNKTRVPTVFMAFTHQKCCNANTSHKKVIFKLLTGQKYFHTEFKYHPFFPRLRSVFETFTLWTNASTNHKSSLCVQCVMAFKFPDSQVRYPCSVLTKKLFKARPKIIKSERVFWQVLSSSVTTINVGNIICFFPLAAFNLTGIPVKQMMLYVKQQLPAANCSGLWGQ